MGQMNLFLIQNPWFNKILNIMTIQSKANYQIAFWRIRYSKNLYIEHISPQKAISFKKFISLIDKIKQRQISKAFYMIDNRYQLQEFINRSLLFKSSLSKKD